LRTHFLFARTAEAITGLVAWRAVAALRPTGATDAGGKAFCVAATALAVVVNAHL
jgi:hypothetical protein